VAKSEATLGAPPVERPTELPERPKTKREQYGKSFTVKCTWRRGETAGSLPTAMTIGSVFDEGEAISQYCSRNNLYSPDCRFEVKAA
jgi:hypothetical protein